MATLKSLSDRMRYLKKEIEKASSKVAVEVAIDVVEYLSKHTPEDTTRAVSNWQIGLGKPMPRGSLLDPHYWYGGEASEQAVRNIAWSMLQLRKPGQKIYISNVTPYIEKLERGISTQAPQGFVQQALLYANVKARNKKLKI